MCYNTALLFVSLKEGRKNGEEAYEKNEIIPLTSSIRYPLHVADGFGYISRRRFDKSALPSLDTGIKRDESKVVFLVEVIQNGRQSRAGLWCERHNEMMSSRVWGGGKEEEELGLLETVSPAPSSAHSSSRSDRSQTRHSLGPWADWAAQRSAQSSR